MKRIVLALAGAAAATALAAAPAATAADHAGGVTAGPAATGAVWTFTGYTSTDPGACDREGQARVAAFPHQNRQYLCWADHPVQGVDNLRIYFQDSSR